MNKIMRVATVVVCLSHQAVAVIPEEVLRDDQNLSESNGVVSRKGSIKAFMENIKIINCGLKDDSEGHDFQKALSDLEQSMETLESLGVFNLFTPLDWFQYSNIPGHVMVGVIYLERNPGKMTVEIKKLLEAVKAEKMNESLSNRIASLIQKERGI